MSDTADWTQAHATEVRNHWWWRPGWRVGRRFYTWHLTFDGQHELHSLVDHYQTRLSRIPGLDLVPRGWLHLTMQGIGFTDEISTSDLTAISQAARRHLSGLTPFEVTFHRCVVRSEAVALPPTPVDPIHQVRTAIRHAIADVWGPGQVPESPEGFQPHLSLAYSAATGPAKSIVAAVAEADPVRATARINEATLIELHRDHQMYQWHTVKTVPLGGSTSTATTAVA